jgi:multiple sugar transport system substrate-binding protein
LLDGPWNPGVIVGDFGDFLPQLGVGPIPTPEGDAPVLTRPPTGGTFWVSGQSDQVDQASALIELFVGEDYQQGLAEAMDQPPLDLDAVAGSAAHETYKRCVEMFSEQVFLGPTPSARNPLVTEVEAAMTQVEPGLGAIVQGVFSGDVTDIHGALQTLSDAMTEERDAAIADVGGDVSAEDWAFPDWRPGEDYGPERYTE